MSVRHIARSTYTNERAVKNGASVTDHRGMCVRGSVKLCGLSVLDMSQQCIVNEQACLFRTRSQLHLIDFRMDCLSYWTLTSVY